MTTEPYKFDRAAYYDSLVDLICSKLRASSLPESLREHIHEVSVDREWRGRFKSQRDEDIDLEYTASGIVESND
jgi:hypothetical protein